MFLQEEYNHCSTAGPSENSWFDQMQKIVELIFVRQRGIEANYFHETIMLNRLLWVLIHQGKYSNI